MPTDFAFREEAVSRLTQEKGVYVLCDLDQMPIYVGQSVDGIRTRVRRHLTSARSDIIANRLVDIWEIGFVHAYPEPDESKISLLESALYHTFSPRSPLMNGRVPPMSGNTGQPPQPSQVVQVLPDHDLIRRRDLSYRLPRQLNHYMQLLDYYLNVKPSDDIARVMRVHSDRMHKYERDLFPSLVLSGPTPARYPRKRPRLRVPDHLSFKPKAVHRQEASQVPAQEKAQEVAC